MVKYEKKNKAKRDGIRKTWGQGGGGEEENRREYTERKLEEKIRKATETARN
jgi:hypothetical protein